MPVNLINASLGELTDLLQQLTDDQYSKPCDELSESSVGEHTRHIIEMLMCLVSSYNTGEVDYDQRERSKILETNTPAAISAIKRLQSDIDLENRDMLLLQRISGTVLPVKTCYYRELLYNLEHCVHHQALIKVGVRNYNLNFSPSFGVARSTILYRNQCAQ